MFSVFSKISSGWQLCQVVKISWCFRDWLYLHIHHQGSVMTWHQPTWIVYHYHAGACGRSQTNRASGWSLKTAMSGLVLRKMAVLSVWISWLYGLTWSTKHEAPLTIEIIWLHPYFCFLIHRAVYAACCHIQPACIVEFSHVQYPYCVSATTYFSNWLRLSYLICFLNLVLSVPRTPCCTCMGCITQ
jgi:hypothetical protein